MTRIRNGQTIIRRIANLALPALQNVDRAAVTLTNNTNLALSVPIIAPLLTQVGTLTLKQYYPSDTSLDFLSQMNIKRAIQIHETTFGGAIPNLQHMENLEVISLRNNLLGPDLSFSHPTVQTLDLANNRFQESVAEIDVPSVKMINLMGNTFLCPYVMLRHT